MTTLYYNSPKYNLSKVQPLIIIFCFILSPLFSLPLIFIEIYNRKIYAIWLLIIFLSIAGYLYPPAGDLYRYYSWYYLQFKDVPLSQIVNFYIFDYAWYFLLWLLSNLNLSFQFSLFLSVLIQSSVVFFFLSEYHVFDLRSSILRFFIIICSFIFLGGFWGTLHNRFSVALSFYGITLYYSVCKISHKKALLFAVLSIITHFSFSIFVLLILLYIILKKHLNTFLLTIMTIILSISMLSIGMLLSSNGFEKAVYITEASNWTENQSNLLKAVAFMANKIPFLILTIIVMISKGNLIYRKFILYYLPIYLSTLLLPDLNGRVQTIMLYLDWLFIISNMKKLRKTIPSLFVLLSISSFCLNSLIYNRSLIIGRYYRMIEPIPIILQQSYSTRWIEEHINEGSIIKL